MAFEFAGPHLAESPGGTLSNSFGTAMRDGSLPGLVAILPRGEAIRNFVYTGALDTAQSAAVLTLLSVMPDEEFAVQAARRFDQVIELRSYTERWPVRLTRELLDTAHGRRLWSEAAKERWRRRDYEAQTIPRKLRREIKKLTCRAFANRPGIELLTQAERLVSRCFPATDEYLRLLSRLRPALVFNGSHVHSANAIQVIHAAQSLGIPTATFLFSWDNLTSQGRIMPLYDYYLVWNDDIRSQLLDVYPTVRPDQVFVTGTPQFDFHFQPRFYWSREEFCAQVSADPARPLVLYSTGMDNHMPGEPLIVERIGLLLKEMTALGPPQLLVRLYPKDRHPERFDDVRRRNPDILFPSVPWNRNWLTPKFEDCYLLTNTLRHCDLGINVASTISLELCMFDKPVINVGYNPPIDIAPVNYATYYGFDHYRPVVESGAVSVASSEEEMQRFIIQALSDPAAGRAQRQQLVQRMFGQTLDGRSGQRVGECLLTLLRRHNEGLVGLNATEATRKPGRIR